MKKQTVYLSKTLILHAHEIGTFCIDCTGTSISCDTYGDAWVWIACAPVWRVVLAFVIGKRDQAGADVLLARVAHVTDDSMPLFTSDQWPAYRHALLHTYGE